MSGIMFDLIIVAVVAVSAWRGARKGLVFTLFGLLAFLVALVGANLAATALAPRVAEALEPKLSQVIAEELGENLAQAIPDPETVLSEENALPGLMGVIQGTELYKDTVSGILNAVENGVEQAAETLAGVIARAIVQSVAHGVIYLISFVVILAVWFASAHVLDFVCNLPILHGVNVGGGILFGLFRGALIVVIGAWFCVTFLGLVPEEQVEQSFLLKYAVNPGALGGVLGI